MSNLPEKTFGSLPDELLLIILELISHNDDLLSCRLVCKKWLNIVSKRVRLLADTSVYYFISNYRHELFTNFRTVTFNAVEIFSWPVHFKSVLQHCEKLHFRSCSFKNAKGLKNCILSCTGLKIFEMRYCGFRLGVLESILDDKKLEKSNNLVTETLKLSFYTWPLIRVFEAVGVRVNKLDLEIYMHDDFMEALNFVKQTYGTKLKSLKLQNYKGHDSVLKFLIDWEGLKLENIVLSGPYNNTELVEKFLEQQTALKELECWTVTNTEKYPKSLEKIRLFDIAANVFDEKLNQLIKRVPNLNLLHIFPEDRQRLDLFILSRLKHMQDFKCESLNLVLQIDYTTPGKLNSINRLSLSNVIIDDKTMKDIIQNMPNLDYLSLRNVKGLTQRPFADLSSLGKLHILMLPLDIPVAKELIDTIYLPFLRRLSINLKKRSVTRPNIQISTPAENFPRLRKVHYWNFFN